MKKKSSKIIIFMMILSLFIIPAKELNASYKIPNARKIQTSTPVYTLSNKKMKYNGMLKNGSYVSLVDKNKHYNFKNGKFVENKNGKYCEVYILRRSPIKKGPNNKPFYYRYALYKDKTYRTRNKMYVSYSKIKNNAITVYGGSKIYKMWKLVI